MRRQLLLATCLILAMAGCDKKPTTDETGPPQPRRMMKAGGGSVTGATAPAAK